MELHDLKHQKNKLLVSLGTMDHDSHFMQHPSGLLVSLRNIHVPFYHLMYSKILVEHLLSYKVGPVLELENKMTTWSSTFIPS